MTTVQVENLQKNIIITGGSRTSRSELLWVIAPKLRDKYNKMILGDSVIVSRKHLTDPLVCVIMTVSDMRKIKKKMSMKNISYTRYSFIEYREHSKVDPDLPCDVYGVTDIV